MAQAEMEVEVISIQYITVINSRNDSPINEDDINEMITG